MQKHAASAVIPVPPSLRTLAGGRVTPGTCASAYQELAVDTSASVELLATLLLHTLSPVRLAPTSAVWETPAQQSETPEMSVSLQPASQARTVVVTLANAVVLGSCHR